MTENKLLNSTILTKPTDPRTFVDPKNALTKLQLTDFESINNVTIKYWAAMFNVELKIAPKKIIFIGKTFSYMAPEVRGNGWERSANSYELEIPEGYMTITAAANAKDTDDAYDPSSNVFSKAKVIVGNKIMVETQESIDAFYEKIPVSYSQLGFLASSVNINIQCQLTVEYHQKWQQETFKAIIDGYETALTKYNQALAEENAKGNVIKESNPGFYRQIENMVLRKNCISYIIDHSPKAVKTYGLAMSNDKNTFSEYEINTTAALDDYTSFAKFIEQAFEWDIMSYNFYPYYWGNKNDWAQLYQYDNNDPLFRSFMQSGMARVVVTVRPGFEEAVRFYLQTGQIWNGGEVPIIDDKLFLSIVDELRQPEGKKEGKAWSTRLPTPMTILQADSIGLKVDKALPYDDDLSDFENPNEVPHPTGFHITGAQMGGSNSSKIIEFTFQNLDSGRYKTIGEYDNQIEFPRVYSCMGQEITIDRDARWKKETSSAVIFEQLAEKISLLVGVEAIISLGDNGTSDGITFKIDTTKVSHFSFAKPGNSPTYDSVQVTVIDNETIRVSQYDYNQNRLFDKAGVLLNLSQATNLFPIERFLI